MEKKVQEFNLHPTTSPKTPQLFDMDTKRTVGISGRSLVLIVVGREIPKYPTATLLQDRVHLGQRTGWPQFQIIGRNIWKLRPDHGKVPTPPPSETCVLKKREILFWNFFLDSSCRGQLVDFNGWSISHVYVFSHARHPLHKKHRDFSINWI